MIKLKRITINETTSKLITYTNGEDEINLPEGEIPPEGFEIKKRVPWNKGLTKDDPRVQANTAKCHATRKENGSYTAWNKGLTAETDPRVKANVEHRDETIKAKYGVDNISQYRAAQPGYKVWNKGLTAETDDRMKKASENHKGASAWNKGLTAETDSRIISRPQSQETKEKIRQSHLKPEVQFQRVQTMKANGTLGRNQDTEAEKEYKKYLLTMYSEDDIEHPYFDKDRYPFRCDFYIKSEDKFIEVHGNWTHGFKPYDPNDPKDQEKLAFWKSQAVEHPYYANAIYTWTDLDVRKVEIAKRNNLNFEVVYYKYK